MPVRLATKSRCSLHRRGILSPRRLEKITSISAGIASAAFTRACGEPAHFDSRVWLTANTVDVLEYFRWRQRDAARCALHSWCYWTLWKKGASAEEVQYTLKGRSTRLRNEFLLNEGINFDDLPTWQRGGVGLYWEQYNKDGYNPLKRETVTTTRRRLKVDLELSTGTAYQQFIEGLLRGSTLPSEA